MKKWIFTGIGIILFVIAFFSFVYLRSVKPLGTAEEKAIGAAKKEVKLSKITDVQIYNGNETYYILRAKDSKNQDVIAWISAKNNDVVVKKAKEGITQQQAVNKLLQEKDPKEIISVKLAMIKKRQCWEIYYISRNNLINYYYVDFETGEWLRKIENM
ncbi:DUF5590 domain-containing protein [Bacillus sp. DNRA2]|uniref:cell wall elongation regulator TseB-like domain-containing protein n=1 Tax=Bacillus sp. DNRA2 TaxID=2723053 RepID=UPI00145E4345|nr:DUF5590 domain-containing protein [Bacillus sp. DNRA2]NMD70347.1 DUF5590 domain-containing protein [Bacillus sp. DNRA2]